LKRWAILDRPSGTKKTALQVRPAARSCWFRRSRTGIRCAKTIRDLDKGEKMKALTLLLLVLVLAGCTGKPESQASRSKAKASPTQAVTYEAKLVEVEKKAAQIKVGMKRSEVEALFPTRDGGWHMSYYTRYYEAPEVKIEVPFDETGGAWNKDNLVTGPPKVYRHLPFGD
jgi:hypothetical protein